jgi:hypothetical protein
MSNNELELAKQQGRQEALAEMTEIIKIEKLWKNQDDGFIGALDWMLIEIEQLSTSGRNETNSSTGRFF